MSNQNTLDLSRYLVFSLGTENFAIPLLKVREVIAVPDFTRIPHTPPHFLGIMNLRGQVISVMDLRLKLGVKANETAEKAVIICDLSPLCLGIVVDSVNSVLTLGANEIEARPEIQSSVSSEYIMGVANHDKKLILLIEIARALDVADRVALESAQKSAA